MPKSESPEHFLGTTQLLDLQDSRLRLRAHALTQLCKTDGEKAIALYRYVKKIQFERTLTLRPRTARGVMDAGRGDGAEKSLLLVALLRGVAIPARIRLIELRGEVLRGLNTSATSMVRPCVEIWLHGRWVRTDTHIFDVGYMVSARQRLKDEGWEWGYGIHRNGQSMWNGVDDAFLGAYPTDQDPMVIRSLGVCHDGHHRNQAGKLPQRVLAWMRTLRSHLLTLTSRRAVRGLRQEEPAGAGSQPRRPS